MSENITYGNAYILHIKFHTYTYESREKHLKQTEKQYWKDVPSEAMSSKEEGLENDVLYRHSPA